MTNDELEAVKENWLARFNRLKAKKDWAGALAMLRASPEAEARATRAEAAEAEGGRRRKEMAVEITGLRRSYTDEKVKATRAEAHAERLASALEFITDERVDRENITTAQLEGLRQALSDYNQRTET